MADGETPPAGSEAFQLDRPVITREVLIDFVSDRITFGECPTCRTNDWELAHTDEAEVGVPVFSSDSLELTGHFPMFALFCKNCGFVQLHATKAVRNWLDGQGQLPFSKDGEIME